MQIRGIYILVRNSASLIGPQSLPYLVSCVTVSQALERLVDRYIMQTPPSLQACSEQPAERWKSTIQPAECWGHVFLIDSGQAMVLPFWGDQHVSSLITHKVSCIRFILAVNVGATGDNSPVKPCVMPIFPGAMTDGRL